MFSSAYTIKQNSPPPKKKKKCGFVFSYFAVHESLELQLSDAKLAVLLSQAPAGLGKVDLCSPHHAHVLWGFSQLQLVCPLQLEVLETSGKKKKKKDEVYF